MNRKDRRAAASQAKTKAVGTDPRLKSAETRYGGQTYEIRIYVNTSRDVDQMRPVLEHLQHSRVVRGEKADQIAVTLGRVDDDVAKDLWGAVYTDMERAVAREN